MHFADENPQKSDNKDLVAPSNTTAEKAKPSKKPDGTSYQTRSSRKVKPPKRLIEQC